MSGFLRSLGGLAGGVASGYAVGSHLKIQKDQNDATQALLKAHQDAYKELGTLYQQYLGKSPAGVDAPTGAPTTPGPATGASFAAGAQGNGVTTAAAAPAPMISGRPVRSLGAMGAMPDQLDQGV
jgi:hypothetical protein